MFMTRFHVPRGATSLINLMEDVKQNHGETLDQYFHRFDTKIPDIKEALDQMLRDSLITGIEPDSRFLKVLQEHPAETLDEVYSRAKVYYLAGGIDQGVNQFPGMGCQKNGDQERRIHLLVQGKRISVPGRYFLIKKRAKIELR
ncbi:hypothetical protein POM88_029389 [Heracleum sosnowskyi]|uniref:Uncharacterized protein n=1 Tax=Heracleum sosnowskyi TaxID=360622 RepID=A0AAD8HUM7_9APIA|nr:hypothetical protein POM88_029389 [Heracleum sosnowskyi]